jgi:hypothetical protein
LAICLCIAKVIGGAGPPAMTRATVVFVILWFLASAVNLWVGVYRAASCSERNFRSFSLYICCPRHLPCL